MISHSLFFSLFASHQPQNPSFCLRSMDQERKKRVRSDQGDQDKTTKIAKRQQSELLQGSYTSSSQHDRDHHRRRDDGVAGLGVFDFPWLNKDGGGVSRPEYEWKLEDSFVSQLLGDDGVVSAAATTVTTPAGIEFSFSSGQCLLPDDHQTSSCDRRPAADDFLDHEDELSPSSLLEDYFGFETAESLDCIWSAFA